MVTHYMLTQIPDEIHRNIDAVDSSIDVNAFDTVSGVTPLMQAAIDSDIERTKMLLEQGANPNIRSANADQDYAINYALLNGGKIGSIVVADILLASGADVHVTDARGMYPIHKLMFVTQPDNRWKVLNDLMARGANINAQAEDGSTMLHITVTNFDRDWIDRVNSEYGQILNYNIRDNKGRTPLDLARELGMVSVNQTESVENSILRRPPYIGNDYNVKAMDNQGRTGLELAVIRDDSQFVKELVVHGADLAHQDKKGNTALHYAVLNPDPAHYVQYLLNAKSPVNIANNEGQTPLLLVMKVKPASTRLEVAKLLIDAGSPLTNKNKYGKSILDLATQAGDTNLINLIRQNLEKRRDQVKG